MLCVFVGVEEKVNYDSGLYGKYVVVSACRFVMARSEGEEWIEVSEEIKASTDKWFGVSGKRDQSVQNKE